MGASSALIITVEAIVTALVVYVAGFLLVHFKKIDASTVVGLSSVVNNTLLPCLLFVRLGGSLNSAVLDHSYSIILASVIISTLTFTFSNYVLCAIAKPSRSFKPWFNLGQIIPNEFSLPLLFISSVCSGTDIESPAFLEHEAETRGGYANSTIYLSSEECVEIGEVYNFLYALPLTLALFTIGPLYISQYSGKIKPTIQVIKESQNPVSVVSHYEDLMPRSYHGSQFMAHQRSQAGSQAVRRNSTRPGSHVMLKQVNPVHTSFISMDENVDGLLDPDEIKEQDKSWLGIAKKLFWDILEDPPAVALILGLIVGLIPAIQDLLFGDDAVFKSVTDGLSVLGSGVSSGLNLIMACTLALKLYTLRYKMDMFGNEERVGISRRTLFVYAGARMVFFPLVTFGMIRLFDGSFPDDALLKFVLNLLISMPSSTLLVMLAQVTGDMQSAEILAISGLLQFLVGAVSMAILMVMSLIVLDLS